MQKAPEDDTIEQNVLRAQRGDTDAVEDILQRFYPIVRMKARSYFMAGADNEDLIQEGMIGLYKAIRDYQSERQIPFRAFAEICITRQLITAIKTAMRLKHQPLNYYLSLNRPMYEEDTDRTLMDTLPGPAICDPEYVFLVREQLKELRQELSDSLSEFEFQVLTLYVNQNTYKEIADEMGTTTKAVDNALCRVKRKLMTFYSTKNVRKLSS
ncbi:MAG: RNA polymerase sporulation sigma factor SigH [Tumebacillaceae bacterium]